MKQSGKKPKIPSFSHLWSNLLPRKISFFNWKLLNRLIALPDVLEDFQFNLPSICCFCSQNSESIHHSFNSCDMVQRLWKLLNSCFELPNNSFQLLWDRFFFYWNTPSTKGPLTNLIRILPSIVNWYLWCSRCTHFFEGTKPSIQTIFKRILLQINDILLVSNIKLTWVLSPIPKLLPTNHIRHRPIKIIRWSPSSRFKLNTDGSISKGGAGIGCIIRDQTGKVLLAVSKSISTVCVLQAEASALLHDIQIARDKGLTSIDIETDSKVLIEIIRRQFKIPWRLLPQVRESWALLQHFDYTLRHIYREANSAADSLAKMAANTQVNATYSHTDLPQPIAGQVILDAQGTPNIRLD